jgi:hypothetical protein
MPKTSKSRAVRRKKRAVKAKPKATTKSAKAAPIPKASLRESLIKVVGDKPMSIADITSALKERGLTPKAKNESTLRANINNTLLANRSDFSRPSRGLYCRKAKARSKSNGMNGVHIHAQA